MRLFFQKSRTRNSAAYFCQIPGRASKLPKAIDRLASHPQLGESLKGEWKGYFKYRTGDYRIIYRIEHSRLVIYIVTVDNRKDVYK